MAGSSVIGALRVDLGLNSAQFNTGLAKAQTGLKGFGKAATVGFAAVAVAATAAATAIGMGIKHALDHADALGKSAQKAGVAVEALSRLEYAGKLADVSLESLTGGLQKLSKSMVEVAGGKGPASAFQALGIAVKDGLGNLRSGDQVFADIADRFSRMEDGALKTSLAMQIFGKSGAELIPLLNEGRDGLAAMAAESDKVGYTLTGKTTVAAEKFNDTITAMQLSLQGVFNRIIGDEGVMTALQSLAGTLASPEFATAMTTFANGVISSINLIAQAATAAMQAVTQLEQWAKQSAGFWNGVMGTSVDKNAGAGSILDNPSNLILPDPVGIAGKEIPQSQWQDILGGHNVPGFIPPAVKRSGFGFPPIEPFKPIIAGAGEAAKALEPLDLGLQEVEDKVTSLAETISSTLAGSLTNIAETLLTGGDAAAAFANEMKNLGLQLLRSGLNSLFTNALGGLNPFGGSKGYTPGFGSYGMFAEGGISNVPAIFGESGPEAAVPLPDGRRIPVELRGNTGGDSLVRIELGPELVGRVLKQAANQSVQIVKSQASAAVASDQRNKRF